MYTNTPLRQGAYYHIYNRGNNRENIFIQKRDYLRFLKLYLRYIDPIAETFAYCLMCNHFHFLIHIKDASDDKRTPSRCFSHMFNAYARYFNLAYQRTGTLFQRPFGRIHVANERYAIALMIYIHHNPQNHGFVADFRKWPFSSYNTLISTQATHLQRDTVLSWFGGVNAFVEAHAQSTNIINIRHVIGDDEFPSS